MVVYVSERWKEVQLPKYKHYRPGQPNWEYKMWKFKGLPAPQILREINFGHFEAPKTAILTF